MSTPAGGIAMTTNTIMTMMITIGMNAKNVTLTTVEKITRVPTASITMNQRVDLFVTLSMEAMVLMFWLTITQVCLCLVG